MTKLLHLEDFQNGGSDLDLSKFNSEIWQTWVEVYENLPRSFPEITTSISNQLTNQQTRIIHNGRLHFLT